MTGGNRDTRIGDRGPQTGGNRDTGVGMDGPG